MANQPDENTTTDEAENKGPDAGTTDAEQKQSAKGTAGDTDDSANGETDDAPEGEDETAGMSIEDYKAATTRANGEAAKYRTKLREVESRLAEAKTQADIDSAVADLKAENDRLAREVLVSKAVRAAKLPDELVDRLKGETEAELIEDAKKLAAMFGVTNVAPPREPAGGLTPNEDSDDELDPRKLAARFRRR
jgi:hypothetical protein